MQLVLAGYYRVAYEASHSWQALIVHSPLCNEELSLIARSCCGVADGNEGSAGEVSSHQK